jgi:hypothetical protein
MYTKIVFPLLLVIVGLLFALIQNSSRELYAYGISGLFVPDSISLRNTLLVYAGNNHEIPYENLITFYLVMFIYYPAAKFGSWLFIILNVAIISLSLIVFSKTIAFYSKERAFKFKLRVIASLAVGLNPYIISIISYPSKEMLLLLMTNLYIYYAVRTINIYPLYFISLCAYFIRDGYGLILILLSTSIFILKFLNHKRKYLLFISLTFIILASLDPSYISWIDNAVERNLMLVEKYDFYNEYPFIYKFFGNIFNLGLRPQFLDISGSLYIINIGLWMLGVCIISGLLWSIINIGSGSGSHSKTLISFIIIFIVMLISYGSYIQPRYLMPLMMFLSIGLSGYLKWPSLLLCLLMPIIFFCFDLLPELQQGVPFD